MSNLALRRAWFQVHKWIGLILAILIVPLCLSGAALVWDEPLDRLANPARYETSGDALLAPASYVAAAKALLKPGERVAQLTLPERGGPVIVAASGGNDRGQARRGPPLRTMVYLDPPTARVLQVAKSNTGLIRFLHVLHGSLQVPGVGRMIVGWIGVFMMVSALTGLWLWWPTMGSVKRAFRWGRHRNLDTNIHQTFGFWIALPLFVLSLTGAWISFPGFFGALSGGGGGKQRGPDRGAMMRAQPLDHPAQSLDIVVARASAIMRGRVRSIAWPTTLSSDWTVTFSGPARAGVKVADDTGSALAAPGREQGGIARLMRRVHDGSGMGIVWQVIIFVGGILPAVLAVTGIIMWWRNRGWRAAAKARQRALRS